MINKIKWDSNDNLGFLNTSSDSVTEDMILDYLAGIIADIYLDEEAKMNNSIPEDELKDH